ncbi:MAG TPA: asparagine synthase (glutamine-hydrolyzing), partial [Myxococcales bacterium]|nr:asparagine synthase (glutamine-hydrolyzing) [Myxococcales bacterium]
MCGIAGYLGGSRPPLADALASLRHRGPDGQGQWEGELAGQQAGLAHARLAIIDLSPAGQQPMATADGKLRLVFNGEIYNFRELRAELERLGHAFHTHTDTEVILLGYRQWGDDVVTHLRGMFAFALYDFHKDRALLARDRLGIKPLYYQALPGTLRFASEAKGILAMLPERPGVDLYALRDYLTYLYVPYPRTIYQGMAQLPPAHVLVWEKGRASLHRYWRLPEPERKARDERELALELRSLLEETVRLHLVSDVPLGAFLSGGLDSTTLVALMARETGKRVKTFCMTFEPDAGLYDEREYARAVADMYGTDHTEIPVKADLTDLLPATLEHFDEPFGNPTSLLVYLLSQKTREHVTVALAGDG